MNQEKEQRSMKATTKLHSRRSINIKVIGIGCGGIRIISKMIDENVPGLDLIATDTDQLELNRIGNAKRLLLGFSVAKGNGSGSDVEIGRRACMESSSEIKRYLEGTDMVFIVAGLGGGTSSGGAEIIATIAREVGVLTVSVVTTPFKLEGSVKLERANNCIAALEPLVDSVIVIDGNSLMEMCGNFSMSGALNKINQLASGAVQTLTNLMTMPALLALNFADIKKALTNSGLAVFTTGRSKGAHKAAMAAKAAVTSPLVNFRVRDAKQAIVSVIGGDDVSLNDAHEAVAVVRKTLGEKSSIIFGIMVDHNLKDEVIFSVIVTGVKDRIDLHNKKPAVGMPSSKLTTAKSFQK